MRIVVIAFLLMIVASLGSALFLLMRDRNAAGGTRVARTLAIRVGLSLTLFTLLMAGFATGLIEGRL